MQGNLFARVSSGRRSLRAGRGICRIVALKQPHYRRKAASDIIMPPAISKEIAFFMLSSL